MISFNNLFKEFAGNLVSFKLKRSFFHRISQISAYHKIPWRLTKKEEKEVCKHYGRSYLKTFNFYKYYYGEFSIEFIPDYLYSCIELSLNHRRYEGFPQHKCNLRYFIEAINRPKTLAYCIDGIIYDINNKQINEERAIELIAYESQSVFKFANYTGGGKGVKLIRDTDYDTRLQITKELIKLSNRDWLAQAVINQLPQMASLGFGSINTIRVLSLYLGSEVRILSSFVRIGGENSFIDNLHGGHGALVGVKQDGKFHSWGITEDYTRVTKSPSGVQFVSFQIPNYEKIVDFIKSNHPKFQHCHLIGWDIALDESGEIIVIEVNLDSAEIAAHQIFNGPIFSDYYTDVMNYVKRNPPVKMIKTHIKSLF